MSKKQEKYPLPLIIQERDMDCKGLGRALSEWKSFASENAILSVEVEAGESLAKLFHFDVRPFLVLRMVFFVVLMLIF